MGGKNVKNTIVERVLHIMAPHPCFGCGKIGSVLCHYCKYNIVSEPFVGCFMCGLAQQDGVCLKHISPISRSFIVGRRTGALKELIDGLKFRYLKSASYSAALLLHESLPQFPPETVIIPIPTVATHIRQRGYDQVLLISRHFAKLRSLQVAPALQRATKTTQHVLNRESRLKEAALAFIVNDRFTSLFSDKPVLILDDIITTGATVSEAAKQLSTITSQIWVGALAYQPLD